MSFASMNGINAAKGMSGTTRQTTAAFTPTTQPLSAPPQGMTPPPQPVQNYMGAVTGKINPTAPTSGGTQGLSVIGNPYAGSSYTKGNGMRGGNDKVGLSVAAGPNPNGVVAGIAGPSAVGPMPTGPQFDPNDPRNAALAGYMAGA